MASKSYDRYMLVHGAGRDAKLAGLTDPERCAYFLGVLSIASQAPVRGYLLLGEEEAGPDAVAMEAAVSKRVARSAMDKLKKIGVLQRDEELGAWFPTNWWKFNPEPKKDPGGAKRQAEYRARRTARNAGVTA